MVVESQPDQSDRYARSSAAWGTDAQSCAARPYAAAWAAASGQSAATNSPRSRSELRRGDAIATGTARHATAEVNTAIIGFYPTASQNVSFTGSSAQSSAVAMTTWQVRLIADNDCYVAFGSNPTATTSGTWLPATSPEFFAVRPGDKIAVIQKSASGTLNVSEMNR